MQLHFTKMHGCGNDYIYLDCRETGLPAEIAAWSQKLSRRHFSIGADGIICICPPLTADGDATMRMFNADGSEGKMCGNGVRCVAQFLYTHGVPKDVIEIDTLMAGRKTLRRKGEGLWQAEMGHFSAMADTLPAVGLGTGPLVHAPLTTAGKTWDAACISTGNPHCIIEWPDCDTLPTGHALAAIGRSLSTTGVPRRGQHRVCLYRKPHQRSDAGLGARQRRDVRLRHRLLRHGGCFGAARRVPPQCSGGCTPAGRHPFHHYHSG